MVIVVFSWSCRGLKGETDSGEGKGTKSCPGKGSLVHRSSRASTAAGRRSGRGTTRRCRMAPGRRRRELGGRSGYRKLRVNASDSAESSRVLNGRK